MHNKEFLKKYADEETCRAWREKYVEALARPPVVFTADGVDSRELFWKKTVGESRTVTDYEKTSWPAQRNFYTVNYYNEKTRLSVEVTVTSYPDYPVVEYKAVLQNTAEENSPEIKNLYVLDTPVAEGLTQADLHTFGGCPSLPQDYEPFLDYMKNGDTKRLEATTGKPTQQYLPNYNIENKAEGRGTICVMGWPGKWFTEFSMRENQFFVRAGEYKTDFVLLPGESFRSPVAVLLFYRGEAIDGQNLYRRWIYEHNIMRQQGVRDSVRMMLCIGDPYPGLKGNAADDIMNIERMAQEGLAGPIDEFCQDAGWYDCDDDWYKTGNWYPDPERYPDGLGVVGEACHKAGLQYHVWFEPERAITYNRETVDLRDCIMGYQKDENGRLTWRAPRDIKRGEIVLINYSLPRAVEYTIEYVNRLLDEGKVDIYRQDFNIEPAPFWDAYDLHLTETMGIPRWGITEEKYTAGYMRLWQSIVDRHPGMMIDACASGGMRNDLETVRFSYPHTRTDWNRDLEDSQCHTYGMAQWYVLMGGTCNQYASATETESFDPYQRRSETVTSAGFGFNFIHPMSENFTKRILTETALWKGFAQYVLYDFYPLTGYSRAKDAVMAFQYNNPEEGIGMLVAYNRPEAACEYTVHPTHLEEEAHYILHDEDEKETDRILTGKELMTQGLSFRAHMQAEAPCYTYKKA